MKFKTHNEKFIDICWTSLITEIKVSFAILEKLFGKPTTGDGYKIDAEWEIEFEDGKVATIYNYKDGKNYNGRNGIAKTEIMNWHIGGHEEIVAERIKKIISQE